MYFIVQFMDHFIENVHFILTIFFSRFIKFHINYVKLHVLSLSVTYIPFTRPIKNKILLLQIYLEVNYWYI